MIASVGTAQADGTVTPIRVLWGDLGNGIPYIFTSEAAACAYKGWTLGQHPYISTPWLMCISNGSPMLKVSAQATCPANAQAIAVTCTCNAGYLPDMPKTSCVPVTSCPAHASGTPCICDPGYQFDAPKTSCVQEEQYTLALTPTSATIEPGQSIRFTVTVENQLDHQPPKHPVTVNISLKVEATSGGHAHGDSTRPRGGINNTPCASDATCKTLTIPAGSTTATFDFNSTDAAGSHTVTASCDKCANEPPPAKVTVMVQGLSGIPASPYYELQEPDPNSRPAGQMKNIGGTADHKDNHFATATARKNLGILAEYYYKTINPGQKLYINDASLVWGGLLDDDGNWAPPHSTHRRGDAIDIRADSKNKKPGEIPFGLFDKVQKAKVSGMKPEIHCYEPQPNGKTKLIMAKAANPAACDGLNRGRHFHIIFK